MVPLIMDRMLKFLAMMETKLILFTMLVVTPQVTALHLTHVT